LGGFARAARLGLLATRAIAATEPVLAILPLRAILGRRFFGSVGELFLAIVAFELVIALAAGRILILETRPVFTQNAKIMVRELQIIFGLDAVAGELGVARHAFVFLEQLSGIAALAIVLAVTRLTAEILAPLPTTAAPAAALSIIDQMPTSLRSVF